MDHATETMTLLQFVTAIGNAIRLTPLLQGAWVTAELSDLRIAGGHCYMELIEKNQSGQTVAKMRAMIWQSSLMSIRRNFTDVTGRDLCSGLKVMVYGSVNHHPVYGMAMTITKIDPSYTLGDMERIRREILERLTKENVIDFNRKVPFPIAPQRIAVISAEGAAGYGDFINQLTHSAEGFVFYPHLFPAVMQGENCAPSVMAALEMVEMTIDLWDAVVIIRGGGATTDLNGFDDYALARRVATFPLPVVVGIGHERDRTVLDEIANTRCKTPTAVAAFLIDCMRQTASRLASLGDFCVRYCSERIAGENMRLSNLASLIPAAVSKNLSRSEMLLSRVAASIPTAAGRTLTREQSKLNTIVSLIKVYTVQQNRAGNNKLVEIAQRIGETCSRKIDLENRKLESLGALVRVLDPKQTLKRGYSITRCNGHAVTDVSAVSVGDKIVTTLLDGEIVSEVV